MSTFVRIKRRLDEDPLETLILNCKRRKGNENETSDPEELSTLFQLAGTSKSDENIENLLKKHRQSNASEMKQQFKKREINMSDKLRSEIKKSSKNSRYRVVNCFRKNLDDLERTEEAGTSNESEVTIFDLETDTNRTAISTDSRDIDQTKYVYDFYYTSSDDLGEADINEYVSIMPCHDPLIFGSLRDNGIDSESDFESDDSNAENNWRNDYPDEDDLESINETDMVSAVKDLNIDDLSSDEGEEHYVYCNDEEEYQNTEQDIDKEDELRYGKQYAIFKAKHNKIKTSTLASDFYYGDIDEEEYYY